MVCAKSGTRAVEDLLNGCVDHVHTCISVALLCVPTSPLCAKIILAARWLSLHSLSLILHSQHHRFLSVHLSFRTSVIALWAYLIHFLLISPENSSWIPPGEYAWWYPHWYFLRSSHCFSAARPAVCKELTEMWWGQKQMDLAPQLAALLCVLR